MVTCNNCGLEIQGEFKFCPSCGTKIVSAPDGTASLIGATLANKYRIHAELGSGAMGTVYLAEHVGLKKKIAIKVLGSELHVSEDSLKRFQREGIAAGKFSHPNAIQIFDFDRADDETFFLAMEYVEGVTLREVIEREGRLDPESAVRIARQVISALDEAHRGGIIHRDLKPENIMVTTSTGGEQVVKVLDFGLSKLVDVPGVDSIKTEVGRILGSPRYMAPEQCAGRPVDHRIDLYAAGLILFEMLAGEPPSVGDTMTDILMKRISEPAPSLIEQHPKLQIPAGLDAFLRKALENQPNDRFQSAEEMIAALEGALDPSLEAAAPREFARRSLPREELSRHTPGVRRKRAFQLRALLVGAAGIATAIILILIITQGDSSDSAQTFSLVSMKNPDDRTEVEHRYVARLQDAKNLLADRDYDQALAAVEDMVRMECADAEAYQLRGRIYHERGDLDMARVDFEEAIRSAPGWTEAESGLGWVYLAKEDPKSALRCFERAVQIDGRFADGLAGQGVAYYDLGEHARAQGFLESVLDIDSTHVIANHYLGMIHLSAENLDAAVENLIRAVRSDPKASGPHTGLGNAYLCQGDSEQAERQFREALELDPDSLEARIALTAFLVDEERFEEARPLLDEGIRRHSGAGQLHVLLGVILAAEGLDSEAVRSLKKGIEHSPDDPEARTFLGIVLQRQECAAEAIEQYRAAAALDKTDALPLINLGLALFSLERYEEAGQALKKASSIDSDNAFIHYNLGIIYMEYLGETDWAIEHFLRFEALGGLDALRNSRVRNLLEEVGY